MATAVAPSGAESGQVDLSTIPISPDGTNGQDENKDSGATEEQITVFHDKDNFNVKHPLMNKWTLWFTKPPSGKVNMRHLPLSCRYADFPTRATIGTIC